jgi:hypothetical protein
MFRPVLQALVAKRAFLQTQLVSAWTQMAVLTTRVAMDSVSTQWPLKTATPARVTQVTMTIMATAPTLTAVWAILAAPTERVSMWLLQALDLRVTATLATFPLTLCA